jgi:hypothetical protein
MSWEYNILLLINIIEQFHITYLPPEGKGSHSAIIERTVPDSIDSPKITDVTISILFNIQLLVIIEEEECVLLI